MNLTDRQEADVLRIARATPWADIAGALEFANPTRKTDLTGTNALGEAPTRRVRARQLRIHRWYSLEEGTRRRMHAHRLTLSRASSSV